MSQIKELYAWIVDDPTGVHGIIGFRMPDGSSAQAVTSKRRLADMLKPQAELAGKMVGLPVKLERFVLSETVETV